MTRFRNPSRLFGPALALALTLTGCSLPGRPKPGPDVPRPEAILDASTLFRQNCSGCHGADGQHGPATSLANPVYQSFVDEATIRDIIANGLPGSLMPAFSTANGGLLVDAQIDSLVRGIRARWYKGNVVAAQNRPPYRPGGSGDLAHGRQVYTSVCAQCHGEDAQHPGDDGSILDGSFLALISPQTIRTTILAGRPDLGMPDYRTLDDSHVLTDAEITDVTAWVMSQRPPQPGQAYPSQNPMSEPAGEAQPNNIQRPQPHSRNPGGSR